MRHSRALVGLLAAAAAVPAAVTAGPAHAATSAGPVDCPKAYPTSQVVDGLTGTGYTVEKGTKPSPFTATVLGRLEDGIGPGVDMILAEVHSPTIDRVGGIWQGMSGSPVYAKDGRLLGAISYGLSYTSSPIAGITPAETMLPLLTGDHPVPPTAQRSSVRAPESAARRLASTGEVSLEQARAGFHRLALPVSVSGASGTGAQKLIDRLQGHLPDASVYAGGSRASAAPAPASQIFAGSNFAAALSTGDVSLVGTGTTTVVCNGRAIAFGHPMLFEGATQLSAHAATALAVQEDEVAPAFKVSNTLGQVGVVDGDRLTGIRGLLGVKPTGGVPITSSLKAPNGAVFTGSTTSYSRSFVSDIAAIHAQAAVEKALGSGGAGSAELAVTIKGTRADGRAFTVTRTDHVASLYGLSYDVGDAVYSLGYALNDFDRERLSLTSVAITGSVSPTVTRYSLSGLAVRRNGAWVKPSDSFAVKAGSTVALRAMLTPYKGGAATPVFLSLAVPAGAKGMSGDLEVTAGSDGLSVEGDTTAELLAELNSGATNDSLRATLSFYGAEGEDGSGGNTPTPKDVVASVRANAAIVNSSEVFGIDVH